MPRSRSRKRRIAVITGTRAEFGLLESTLHNLRANPKVDLHLIATGMHLLPAFGNTVRDIERAGFHIATRVPMQRGDDSATDQAEGLSRGVAGIARYFAKTKIETALVLGDRIEAMAGALAAATTGVRLAHVHGGDVAPGDFDDKLRDSITKLADLHLTATPHAARRVMGMGIAADAVHVVGAPGIDRLAELLRRDVANGRYQSPTLKGWATQANSPYALVVQHAYGRSAAVEERVMTAILNSVRRARLRRLVVAPNSDRGHAGVMRAIAMHNDKYGDDVLVCKSLPRDAFLPALIDARLLVGNSSAGLLEAPFAGTASVNVGDRQTGRLPGGASVVNCGESANVIDQAVDAALRKRPRLGQSKVYGAGGAGKRIAALVARS